MTLDAVMTYRANGADGEVMAHDFFTGLMTTSLPAGACLTAVRFPVWHGESRVGVGFHEVNARRSDFAFVAAAAQVALDESGKAKRIAIGVGAATDVPLRLAVAEKQLTGAALEEPKVAEAVRDALADHEMFSDLHASAEYRRRAAVTLAARAVADAKAQALGSKRHAH
jgi:CO/xanthine dehydrogenase FAD-binding subunit